MLTSLALALVALPQDRTAQFRNDVLPVLQAKCFACHGDDPDDVRGKFDIRSRAGLLRGGESGRAAIVPGDPKASPLFVAITWQDDDLRMPKKKADRLTAAQIEAVRAWIAAASEILGLRLREDDCSDLPPTTPGVELAQIRQHDDRDMVVRIPTDVGSKADPRPAV
jgi:hypothetical protein